MAPVFTATETAAAFSPEEVEQVVGHTGSAGCWSQRKVADVIAFLVGPRSSAVSGEVITIGA